MCGSATLAIVVSSVCMIVASMTATVMKPRLRTGLSPDALMPAAPVQPPKKRSTLATIGFS